MSKVCVVCAEELNLFGPRKNYEYYICGQCKTIQLSPMPDENFLINAYAQEYSTAKQVEEIGDPNWAAKANGPYHQALANAVIDYGISGKVLDFGTAWGHLCQRLINHGIDCIGLEPSKEMADYCKRKGIPVITGGIQEIERSQQKVSAIVLSAVFEHLVNHQTYLERFNHILPVGGYVMTLHPVATFYNLIGTIVRLGKRQKELPEIHGAFAPPWHTTFFSLRAMNILIERSGFKLVEIRRAPQGRIGGFIGFSQICLEMINRVGWFLMKSHWPLITSYTFILKKIEDVGPCLTPEAQQ